MTFAGCAPNLNGHDLTAQQATVPDRVGTVHHARIPRLAKPRTKQNTDILVRGSAKQHAKRTTTTDAWRLQSRTTIPLPDSELLQRPPEPNCELEAFEFKGDDLQKLDYERQCYREAEVIARSRLLLLQTSIEQMIKALEHTKSSNP
jgi:hypothetical protein